MSPCRTFSFNEASVPMVAPEVQLVGKLPGNYGKLIMHYRFGKALLHR